MLFVRPERCCALAQPRGGGWKISKRRRGNYCGSLVKVQLTPDPTRYTLYMNITRLLLSIFAFLFGGFLVVFGGYDDSPGAQALGLLIAIVGIVGIVKSRKKNTA